MVHETWQFWDFAKIFREEIWDSVILGVWDEKLESVHIEHPLGLEFVKVALLYKRDLWKVLDFKPRLCLWWALYIDVGHSGFASETAIKVVPGIHFLLATHSWITEHQEPVTCRWAGGGLGVMLKVLVGQDLGQFLAANER